MITKDNFFKTSDGAYLYYEVHGQGKPILLLPGSNCSTEFFKHNIAGLSANHQLILMDIRSQGRSSKELTGNTLSRHAQDVYELMEHLQLQDVTLAGWSLSGSTAITYCLQYNHARLSRIVLMDAVLHPFSADEENTYRYQGYKIDEWTEDRMKSIYDGDTFTKDFAMRMSNLSTSEDVAFITKEVRKTHPDANLSLHFDFCMTDNTSNLPLVKVPVGLFYAKSKSYGTGYTDYYARKLKVPYRTYTFDKGGHMAFYFDPDTYNRALLEFTDAVF